MKIYALGPAGTYGHEAAVLASKMLAGTQGQLEIEFCTRNIDILLGAQKERILGVVPVENTSAGLVSDVVKDYWINQHESSVLFVIGEIVIPIVHSFLVHPEFEGEVSAVMSHPQALAQCAGSLDKLGITLRIPTNSTALAAQKISVDTSLIGTAAIASSFAGNLYNLKVLQNHFEDFPGNATRFHIVGQNPCPPTGRDKTAVIFWLPNRPRTLVNTLECIGDEEVNMSSIHSIPLGEPGSYAFYCEFDCHKETRSGMQIVDELGRKTEKLLVLGSFPRITDWQQTKENS